MTIYRDLQTLLRKLCYDFWCQCIIDKICTQRKNCYKVSHRCFNMFKQVKEFDFARLNLQFIYLTFFFTQSQIICFFGGRFSIKCPTLSPLLVPTFKLCTLSIPVVLFKILHFLHRNRHFCLKPYACGDFGQQLPGHT